MKSNLTVRLDLEKHQEIKLNAVKDKLKINSYMLRCVAVYEYLKSNEEYCNILKEIPFD